MDSPLGATVGNALETAEAIEILHGRGPDDTRECTLVLGAEMLVAAGVARSRAEARRKLVAAIRDGRALDMMRKLVRAQGGDPRVVDDPTRLPRARHVVAVRAQASGHVHALDAYRVGALACRLGAGRATADDTIDPAVGIVFRKKPGDATKHADVLAELHLAQPTHATWARPALLDAYRIARGAPRRPPLVLGRIT
jgi:thymidine phosphorylase